MTRIGTLINFCSLDYRFIGPCVKAVAPFSKKIVVPFADRLFDDTPEDMVLVDRARGENPEAEFIPFDYHHSITQMLRPRFWHNFARWVGLAHLPEDCDWILFLDADEIVETERFVEFLGGFDFAPHDHLYFANYWYFREPMFRARQIEDSPALIRRRVITVNRIFHEHERATFRRLPNGLRRVSGLDGKPMFHHYSWVMDKAQMLRKVRTWGHSLDVDRDWERLVEAEFSGPFSGKDFVHGYDFDTVEPLLQIEKVRQIKSAAVTVDPASAIGCVCPRLSLEKLPISFVNLTPLSRFVADPGDLGYFLDTSFKEHYRLLSYLSTFYDGETLFDIGTYKGYSALALSYNANNRVVSYDIVDQRKINGSEKLDRIEFRIGDVLQDPGLLQTPLILLDIGHDGVSERRIYDYLDNNSYKGILLLDDIHLNPAMVEFWESIQRPKRDITEVGHVTGTGIVFFDDIGFGNWTGLTSMQRHLPNGNSETRSAADVDSYRNKENYLTPNPRPDQWRGHINSMVLTQFRSCLRGVVVDLGCNHGAMTHLTAEHSGVERVVGIDLNRSALQLGLRSVSKQPTVAPVSFVQSNLLKISLSDASVDAVVSFHTLEHLYPSDLSFAVAEIGRILKPGGHVILGIPYEDAYYTPGQHVSFFNETNLTDLFTSSGFKVVACFRDQRNHEDCLTAVFQKSTSASRMLPKDQDSVRRIGRERPMAAKTLRIGFHSNQLGLRGTDVALYDYALYNREILDNESIIISDATGDLRGLEKFQAQFEVLLYDDFRQVQGLVDTHRIDAVYYQKYGRNDGKLVPGCPNLIHAVFQCFDPHGEVYAYISSWLAEEMSGGRHPVVPYMVDLPEGDVHYREQLGIPPGAVVFGRHGGRDQFNIPFVHEVVRRVAEADEGTYFLFMNTDRFCRPRHNIIHLNPTWDLEAKVGFINTCDAMLHARVQGETFGLAIAEFLLRDKPVIACTEGVDQNHRAMLGEHGLYYGTPTALFDTLIGFQRTAPPGVYRERVAEFSPERVMERFKAVFLDAVGLG